MTFVSLLAITVLVSALASRLTLQAGLSAELEKQLAEAGMERMQANLLRAISHDLCTPPTGIIGNSTVFPESRPHLSEKEKRNSATNIYGISQQPA